MKFNLFFILLFLSNSFVFGQNQLEHFLQTYVKNKRVCYVPNPGNAGDALIWYATITFFNSLGIDYIVSAKKEDILSKDIDIVMYSGGGNTRRVLIKRLWPKIDNVFFLDMGSFMVATTIVTRTTNSRFTTATAATTAGA